MGEVKALGYAYGLNGRLKGYTGDMGEYGLNGRSMKGNDVAAEWYSGAGDG